MHPQLFRIPLPWGHSFPIATYGSMVLIGFLLCLWLMRRRGRRFGLDPNAMFDAATFMLLGGIVGARLFYVIDHWAQYQDNLAHVFRIDEGGLAFFGGLIGGGAGLVGTILARGLPLRTALDVVVSVLPLGHALGRMGCFLNGCCFGKVTSSWVGVRFPAVVDAAGELAGSPPYRHHLAQGLITRADTWSLPVHPTQLYAAGYNLLIFAILSWYLSKRRRPADLCWLYLLLYGSARFTNEFFRADNPPLSFLGGLTLFHLMAGSVAAAGVAMLVVSARKPRVPLPEPWEPPAEPDESP
jgi:phosphatidylglycerol:prolipoprotein diacylglycerol transferase